MTAATPRITASIGDATNDPVEKGELPVPGTLVSGRYVLGEELGRGGMGVVMSAKHRELGEPLAIKFLRVREPDAATRLLREAKIAIALQGEHVARVRDFGMHGDLPFIVMDRLEGTSLAATLAERGTLPVAEALALGIDVCRGLAEAHQLGIVHRDIKPSNLLIERDGTLRILDFGVAKALFEEDGASAALTRDGSLLGSPAYMAPEQIRDAHAVDARADVWSVGATLYECVVGAPPFRAPTTPGLLAAVVADAPAPLPETCPDAVRTILVRCLAKAPPDRYPDVGELELALTHAKRSLLVRASKRRPRAVLAVTACGLALIGALGARWWRARAPVPSSDTRVASPVPNDTASLAPSIAAMVKAPLPSSAATLASPTDPTSTPRKMRGGPLVSSAPANAPARPSSAPVRAEPTMTPDVRAATAERH